MIQHLTSVVLTFEFGRTGCPDPDCGGWTLLAELTIGGAR